MLASRVVPMVSLSLFLAAAVAVSPTEPARPASVDARSGSLGGVPAAVSAASLGAGFESAIRSGLVSLDDHHDEADEADETGEKDEKVKLTLDRIFPEDSFWGPSASRMSFGHDGRFAAFLYRSYAERRHGSDLYIHDTQTGQTRRITTAGRFAEYQADAREVRDDREKRAKKAGVTLGQLAREQAERLGWPGDVPAGSFEGEASAEGGSAIAGGACELSLDVSAKGALSGSVRIGLVRLALSDVEYADGELTAGVNDEDLGVEGGLDASWDAQTGAMTGEIELTEPEQTVRFELEAVEEAGGDPEPGSRGVIGAIGERLTLGDVVLASDADINEDAGRGDRAPRWGGVQWYEWSENASEMLLMSDGDIYRLEIDPAQWDAPIERAETEAGQADESNPGGVDSPASDEDGGDAGADDAGAGDTDAGDSGDEADDAEAAEAAEDADDAPKKKTKRAEPTPVTPYRGELTRLTRTRERESDVQYLPDGSGYTYLRDGALLRVSFGDHRIVQLDPQLQDGERMVGYQISPDGNRLVFLANRGDSYWGRGRQVTIVSYRDRFAQARQVTRHMPDDPWPDAFSSVYLYDLRGHDTEEGTLERVFTKRISGPRDILRVPEWSPDSSRVAFAAFEQSTGLMKIMEAGFVEEGADESKEEGVDSPASEERDGDAGDAGDADSALAENADAEKPDDEELPEFEVENAEVVYEFFHFGGPNTPRMVQPVYLADSRRLAFLTELSGYRQLHLLEPRYQQLTQLTEGRFEVYPMGVSHDHSTMFVTATKGDPNQEHAYSVDLETGEMVRLTPGEGVYSSVAVADDGSFLLASYIDFGSPRELVAVRAGEGAAEGEGETVVMTDSHPEEAHKLTAAGPEYFTYENRHGQTIYGHMFKPDDWSPEDKRPLLIYVYGGPLGERKMATRGSFSAPSYFFARYMAEVHGWVTATIDPRGASGYGAVFEKANFERVGEPQTEDLVDGAMWLVEHAGVDEDKLAMHGWSFGGFQTQMVMYTEPDVFAVGMAGAGPTEWFNYNSWYTTGTVGPHKPGELNLEEHSLLPLAKNLEGRLLLVHGMEDSNVLYQDTVNVYRELLKAGKETNVELFLDPTGGHGLGGDVKTIGRYRKYEDFLLRYLGKGEAAETDEGDAQAEADDAEDADDGDADADGADGADEGDEGEGEGDEGDEGEG